MGEVLSGRGARFPSASGAALRASSDRKATSSRAGPGDSGAPRRAVGSRAMRSEEIEIRTGGNETVRDITRECQRFLGDADAQDGLLHVFVPHATAGLAVIETGAGSDDDLLRQLRELLPADDRWGHRHGSPGHGRDHVLPALISPSLSVPVLGGRM